MTTNELKLEILKLAPSENLCGGDGDRAVEIAGRFWEFLRPTREPNAPPAQQGP